MAAQDKEPGKTSAKGNREGRDSGAVGKGGAKDGKERRDDALQRRLAYVEEELNDLRQAIRALQGTPAAPPPAGSASVPSPGPLEMSEADDALIARIGYALGSSPKVALARLLYTGGEQSAAQLGEQAGLTTGSLYHHLRELMHAELIAQETRNRYQLTERGRHALELLTPFARG